MKKLSIALSVAVIGVLGCADSSTAPATSETPAPPATVTADTMDSVEEPETDVAAPVAKTDKLDAETVLAAAIKTAEADDKRVLVHLGAPW